MSFKVRIELYYIPTGMQYAEGVQWLDSEDDFDNLKDLIAEAVRGKLAFLKLYSAAGEDFVGVDSLIKSKIRLVRCEN